MKALTFSRKFDVILFTISQQFCLYELRENLLLIPRKASFLESSLSKCASRKP